MSIKLIDSVHFLLWTDAPHARQLARTTMDEWDRGFYVRSAVNTAWTVFENYAEEALGEAKLGHRFPERFNEALVRKGLQPAECGKGIWQRVGEVYRERIRFTHVKAVTPVADLRPSTSLADTAIATLREAIRGLAALTGATCPAWVEDDSAGSFTARPGSHTVVHDYATATLTRAGADPNDPQTTRITFVWNGKEEVDEYDPPGTPWEPLLDSLEQRLNVPASVIRAYRGPEVLCERQLRARRSGP